jgi:hypothetical protein
MFRRPFFLSRLVLVVVVTLILFGTPVQALPFFQHGNREVQRTIQAEKERGFFAFLLRLFGKSGGGMDPNGGAAGPGMGPE